MIKVSELHRPLRKGEEVENFDADANSGPPGMKPDPSANHCIGGRARIPGGVRDAT